MPQFIEPANIITIRLKIDISAMDAFIAWQAKLNAIITEFPGFVSLEIVSPSGSQNDLWIVIQRFLDATHADCWTQSNERNELISELKKIAEGNVEEETSGSSGIKTGVTEMLITEVSPDQEKIYRNWMAKIHAAEAKFPGFRGVYVQSPEKGRGNHWITLLQFNTQENLDTWLSSAERKKILEEGSSLIHSVESHRVISPYAGWFASIAKMGDVPPVWKQTLIVLLVLFPIVMLEFKFLLPHLQSLNISLGTFIGNALSVSLISWPMMPLAILGLGWWLSPKKLNHGKITFFGTLLIFALYLLEIYFFWSFV